MNWVSVRPLEIANSKSGDLYNDIDPSVIWFEIVFPRHLFNIWLQRRHRSKMEKGFWRLCGLNCCSGPAVLFFLPVSEYLPLLYASIKSLDGVPWLGTRMWKPRPLPMFGIVMDGLSGSQQSSTIRVGRRRIEKEEGSYARVQGGRPTS